MQIWSGKEAAAALRARLEGRVARLKERGIAPALAIVRMGERPDDLSYEHSALKRCEQTGIMARRFLLDAHAPQSALLAAIREINASRQLHGCLLLRPLPEHIDDAAVCAALSADKDVDGITPGSLAGVFTGSGTGFAPCTARACIEILSHYGWDPAGKRAVVIGRSLVVGKPTAMLLLRQNATVTLCHSHTRDLPAICREADLIVAAAGVPELLGEDCFDPSRKQVVIDVGIHVRPDGTLCGDVAFERVRERAAAITPVPGGVGTVTSCVLMEHVVQAAERAALGEASA